MFSQTPRYQDLVSERKAKAIGASKVFGMRLTNLNRRHFQSGTWGQAEHGPKLKVVLMGFETYWNGSNSSELQPDLGLRPSELHHSWDLNAFTIMAHYVMFVVARPKSKSGTCGRVSKCQKQIRTNLQILQRVSLFSITFQVFRWQQEKLTYRLLTVSSFGMDFEAVPAAGTTFPSQCGSSLEPSAVQRLQRANTTCAAGISDFKFEAV